MFQLHSNSLWRRFLWVRFQIAELCEAMSDEELRQTLENLPKDLFGTYQRILHKIASSTRGSERLKTAKRAFYWIVCAKKPLTIEELIEAVVLEEDDQSFPANRIPTDGGTRLRLACGNLAVFDGKQGSVRFAHQTVQQFLTDRPKHDRFADDDLVNSFRFTFSQAESQVYTLCAVYLHFSDFQTQITCHDIRTPRIAATGGFAPSLINNLHTDTGVIGQLSNLLFGRTGPGNDLNRWSLLIQEGTRPVDHEGELKRKYSLLDYISSWWCFHFPTSKNEGSEAFVEPLVVAKTWELVFTKTFPFPHRPWENGNFDSQHLPFSATPILRWAARTGSFSIWKTLLDFDFAFIDSEEYLSPKKCFHDAILYDNEERDLLADILHGGHKGMLDYYFDTLSKHAIGETIPAWVICRALLLSPQSRHASLFSKLDDIRYRIARGKPEGRSSWWTGPRSTFWLDSQWPVSSTSRFDTATFNTGAGTFLLEEAVKQDDIDLVRCILENEVGTVVYFGPSEPEYLPVTDTPLARAAYGNNTAMVEVLFSYLNGTSPVIRARIKDFNLQELYQGLRKRGLMLMIDHIRALSHIGTGYIGTCLGTDVFRAPPPTPESSRSNTFSGSD